MEPKDFLSFSNDARQVEISKSASDLIVSFSRSFRVVHFLFRHNRLEEEIHAYRSDIVRLEQMATELANSEFMNAPVVHVQEETEELTVPQVRMLYPYSGNNISVKRDEVSFFAEERNFLLFVAK